MPSAAIIIQLLVQYGPLIVKYGPGAIAFLTDIATKWEQSGLSSKEAVDRAFSMHIVAPTQWTQEEYDIFYKKADGSN